MGNSIFIYANNLDEAVDLASSGRLQDAKSVIGLLWAREKLLEG